MPGDEIERRIRDFIDQVSAAAEEDRRSSAERCLASARVAPGEWPITRFKGATEGRLRSVAEPVRGDFNGNSLPRDPFGGEAHTHP